MFDFFFFFKVLSLLFLVLYLWAKYVHPAKLISLIFKENNDIG